MFLAFVLIQIYASIVTPPVFARKEEFFPLNKAEENGSVDADISVSQLEEGHRFVTVNGSLVANATGHEWSLPINLTVRRTMLKNDNLLSYDSDEKRRVSVHWTPDCNKSSLFRVVRLRVGSADRMQILMTVEANYTNIAGFQFRWDFANPSAEKYGRSARLLLSLLIGYMTVIFVLYLKFDAESFTQVMLLIVGITGVLASNPVTYFIPKKGTAARVSDHILIAAFTAVSRLFMICELEMLRSRSAAPAKFFTILFGILIGFYATVDAAAAYDRENHIMQSEWVVPVVLQTENWLMILDTVYGVVSVVYLIICTIQNDGVNARRVGFMAFAVLVTTSVTILTHVVFVLLNKFMYSVMPSILFASTHVTVASMSIFLLHYGGGPEYREFDPSKADAGAMVIDVDQITDDEDEGDDKEEEDEEE
jgi:hypothetical protein